jgi:hypothetical protein
MLFISFKEWLIEEQKRIPLPEADKNCQTSCARATVVWLIKLEKDWKKYFDENQLKSIQPFVNFLHDGEYVEGLEASKNKFFFKSKTYKKIIPIIPQEEEIRGFYAIGVKPISGGSITIRPRKSKESEEYGNYVSENEKINIPSDAIRSIKAIGGCALTCLHMSGGHVTDKTVGGYRKTFMFKTNEDLFYNTTLSQYFKSALKALFNKCKPESDKNKADIDHYAIRLNGTTDITHFAKKFTLDPNTIKSINKTINSYNKSGLSFSPITINVETPVNFFEIFNQMWHQVTQKVNCKFDPAFIQFYDYTALESLKNKYSRKELPSNYHITFSAKEGNLKEVMDSLNKGMGVALPIWIGGVKKTEKIEFPQKWYPYGFSKQIGFRIVDGDSYDARFLDKKIYNIPENEGYVIGLRAKGKLEDIQDHDSGFAERILTNAKNPDINSLRSFSDKYNSKIKLNDPNFDQIKKDFMQITGSSINKRFDPNDPAINKIVYEQIIYTLRRNEIPVNNMGLLKSKEFYDSQEAKGVERLISIKDLDYDKLHSIAGTSAKTDKGDAKQTMSGSSSKVEKSSKYKVLTNQTNMLPHTTFAALKNQLDFLKAEKNKQQLVS